LRQRGKALYQALKPDGVEGNAFNYHLRSLRKAKLIMLADGGYALTHIGQLVSDAFSYDSKRLMLRPHMYTVLLITAGERMLVYAPVRQPTAGWLCLPSGKLHYEDSFADSIRREVQRRNLSDEYTTTQLCAVNIRYTHGGNIIMQRPGVVWHVTYDGPLVDRTTDSGSTFWMTQRELLTSARVLPDISEALTRLSDHSNIPIDLEWSLDR
jgi:hypothetical protein